MSNRPISFDYDVHFHKFHTQFLEHRHSDRCRPPKIEESQFMIGQEDEAEAVFIFAFSSITTHTRRRLEDARPLT
ncbi:Protein of unknown function [Gryllus bimaculatus]|nr:Protein of unknown function [Gryllus bimaculatus]